MSFESNTENSTDTDPAAHWSFETKQVRAGVGSDDPQAVATVRG